MYMYLYVYLLYLQVYSPYTLTNTCTTTCNIIYNVWISFCSGYTVHTSTQTILSTINVYVYLKCVCMDISCYKSKHFFHNTDSHTCTH